MLFDSLFPEAIPATCVAVSHLKKMPLLGRSDGAFQWQAQGRRIPTQDRPEG